MLQKSEVYHLKSIEIVCRFIKSNCPYINHLISSYQKHYNSEVYTIPDQIKNYNSGNQDKEKLKNQKYILEVSPGHEIKNSVRTKQTNKKESNLDTKKTITINNARLSQQTKVHTLSKLTQEKNKEKKEKSQQHSDDNELKNVFNRRSTADNVNVNQNIILSNLKNKTITSKQTGQEKYYNNMKVVASQASGVRNNSNKQNASKIQYSLQGGSQQQNSSTSCRQTDRPKNQDKVKLGLRHEILQNTKSTSASHRPQSHKLIQKQPYIQSQSTPQKDAQPTLVTNSNENKFKQKNSNSKNSKQLNSYTATTTQIQNNQKSLKFLVQQQSNQSTNTVLLQNKQQINQKSKLVKNTTQIKNIKFYTPRDHQLQKSK